MKYFTIICLVIIIAGCKPSVDTSGDAQEKIDIVHQYFDAIIKQDLSSMKKLLADDFVSHGPGLKKSVTKAQNLSDWEKGWEERIVSVKYKRIHSGMVYIEKGKLAGDWVSEWGEVTTLYKDGKTVKYWFNGLYKVADGLIREARVVFDNMDILNQLGYKFLPPADIIDEAGH
jgi:predicted ester cyclase